MSDITSWGTHNTGIDERLKYFADPKSFKNQPVYPGAQEFVHKLSKKAEVVIATNVPAQCAGVRINAIVKNFPEIKISNILIGARKDLLNADMMLDDAPQNLDGANTRYPVLFRQPWNYGKTGLLSVSTYAEFLTLVDLIRTSEFADYDANEKPEVIVLVDPSGSGKKKLADELFLYYSMRSFVILPLPVMMQTLYLNIYAEAKLSLTRKLVGLFCLKIFYLFYQLLCSIFRTLINKNYICISSLLY